MTRGALTGRLVLGGLGVAVGLYGAFLLLSRGDAEDWTSVAVWLAAGVVLHDVVLAGAVLGAGWLLTRVLPRSARAPATVALVVMGSLTLVAVPVLGRFGARPDNPTLLDRPYLTAWLVLAALTVVAVAVASGLAGRRSTGGPAGRAGGEDEDAA